MILRVNRSVLKMKITVAGLVALVMAIVAAGILYEVFQDGGKWEVAAVPEGDDLVLTVGHSDEDFVRTIIFQGANMPGVGPRRYVFPDDHANFHPGQVKFADYTLLPGRVILVVDGIEIDMMRRALIVGGAEYSWTESEAIVVRPAHESVGNVKAGSLVPEP